MSADNATSTPVDDEVVSNAESDEESVDSEDIESYVILQGTNRDEMWEELDASMKEQVSLIVIDDESVGKESAATIRIGNTMHKSAVLSGLLCLMSPVCSKYMSVSFSFFTLPFGAASVVCALAYHLEWRKDPLCKYQVDWDGSEFRSIPVEHLRSSNPVVLVRRDDSVRKVLHNGFAIGCAAYCLFGLYKLTKSN